MRARRHGFIMLDAIAGLMIVATLAFALTLSVQGYRGASQRLRDDQAAAAIAERVLVDLRSGRTPMSDGPQTIIQLRPLDDGQALPGQSWVRVRVEHRGRSAQMIGLVPTAMLGGSR